MISQLIAATERGKHRLAEIETELTRAGREGLFAPIIFAEDVRAAWAMLTTDRKRAMVAALFEVVLLPQGRGRQLRSTPEMLNLAEMAEFTRLTDRAVGDPVPGKIAA